MKRLFSLSFSVVRWPASWTVRKNKLHSPHLWQRRRRERASPGQRSQHCLSLSPWNTLRILPHTIRFQWSLSRHTIVFTRRGGNVAMEPTLGSVCVFTWACAWICMYILTICSSFYVSKLEQIYGEKPVPFVWCRLEKSTATLLMLRLLHFLV